MPELTTPELLDRVRSDLLELIDRQNDIENANGWPASRTNGNALRAAFTALEECAFVS